MYFSKNKEIVTIGELDFVIYLSARDLQNRIRQMAVEICKDYHDKEPIFLIVLNGGLIFGADLMRYCDIASTMSCVKLKSYEGLKSTENLTISLLNPDEIKDKDIVIIEDIIDTGFTMNQFLPKLNELGAKSVKLATLLHKPEAQKHPVDIDYIGFSIPNKFVVGYGLDYDGKGRNLPHIYQLIDDVE